MNPAGSSIKRVSQKDLATKIYEKPHLITYYEAGKEVSNIGGKWESFWHRPKEKRERKSASTTRVLFCLKEKFKIKKVWENC